MKCTCETCQGSGEITCQECAGTGTFNDSIETVKLEKSMRNYEELMDLKKDAKRVISQTKRLCALKPNRTDAYEAQLRSTLFVINGLADRASEHK